MKKILLSVSMIAVVAIAAIGATGAFFSDTETSTGNTFTAGSLDLQIYAGDSVANLVLVNNTPIFSGTQLADVKPGDSGATLVKLVSIDNNACGYANVTLDTDSDVSCTEPELVAESGCTPGGNGELNDNMNFTLWYDVNGDGIQSGAGETDIITDQFDSNMGPISIGELIGGTAGQQIGIKWNLPSNVGNDTQTDSFSGTFAVNITQQRNQFPNNICPEAGAAWIDPVTE